MIFNWLPLNEKRLSFLQRKCEALVVWIPFKNYSLVIIRRKKDEKEEK